MKYLAHHSSPEKHRATWACGKTLLVVRHYFWKSEKPLERSLEGLMRSLLYQILGRHPEFIDSAFPDREWVRAGKEDRFTKTALQRALRNVLRDGRAANLRFFFAIDELDEFDQPDELIHFLQIFYGSSSIKLCVSSRPLNAFREEFGQGGRPSLDLRGLTE
ncbi:hypothetical protein BCR34DRAFT_631416 [Clohesyomyces aquaticus]|uniref:Nephrocystin 3-like N-terminal domain-containing protein n=1 Tax=Clohesyomyces aquaticus TaxID=1231657 RepID=A0A1Y2A518_9PLEO|nr:hypothetical protein BCR34DRAFT_631416 [Clohesyomyces aquaticus]